MKWTDEKLGRALRALAQDPQALPWSERVWDRIESRLARRKAPSPWVPWVRPARLAVAGAGFAAVLCGLLAYQNSAGQADLASYLLRVSDDRVEVPQDLGVVKTSVLLTAPSPSPSAVAVPVMLGEDGGSALEEVGFSNDGDDSLSPI